MCNYASCSTLCVTTDTEWQHTRVVSPHTLQHETVLCPERSVYQCPSTWPAHTNSLLALRDYFVTFLSNTTPIITISVTPLRECHPWASSALTSVALLCQVWYWYRINVLLQYDICLVNITSSLLIMKTIQFLCHPINNVWLIVHSQTYWD